MQESTLAVTVLWGDTILEHLHLADRRALSVGDVLVVKRGSRCVVRFPDREQEIEVGPSRPHALSHGTLEFYFHCAGERLRLEETRQVDRDYPRMLALSAATHAFFVAASMVTPASGPPDLELVQRHKSLFSDVHFIVPRPKKVEPLKGRADAGKAIGLEGAIGSREMKPKARRSAPKIDPNAREHDLAQARRSGLLGAMREMGAATSNVMSGEIGDGINVALAGIKGSGGLVDAGGAGGLGSRGTGPGGGGASLSIGGLRTHGRGGSYGDPNGLGIALGATRRAAEIPNKRFIMNDGLDRAVVARVIRRALPRIKFCYEKQMQADPNLAGKVGTRFTIAPTGRVAAAQVVESTIDSRAVESCVVEVLKSLVFPKPKGGGVVVVSYPFIFAST